jgi:hypothetical protein
VSRYAIAAARRSSRLRAWMACGRDLNLPRARELSCRLSIVIARDHVLDAKAASARLDCKFPALRKKGRIEGRKQPLCGGNLT